MPAWRQLVDARLASLLSSVLNTLQRSPPANHGEPSWQGAGGQGSRAARSTCDCQCKGENSGRQGAFQEAGLRARQRSSGQALAAGIVARSRANIYSLWKFYCFEFCHGEAILPAHRPQAGDEHDEDDLDDEAAGSDDEDEYVDDTQDQRPRGKAGRAAPPAPVRKALPAGAADGSAEDVLEDIYYAVSDNGVCLDAMKVLFRKVRC